MAKVKMFKARALWNGEHCKAGEIVDLPTKDHATPQNKAKWAVDAGWGEYVDQEDASAPGELSDTAAEGEHRDPRARRR